MDKPLSYILNHLGEEREKYFNAVSPPVMQSSNFVFNSFSDFREAISDELNSHIYTRGNNPTVQILRKKIAALEKTEDALIFSSGMGAISAAVISQVKSGDHIICVDNPYSWTSKLMKNYLERFNVEVDFVAGSNFEAIENALQDNTRVLYLESPNTASFEIQDLKRCGAFAKEHSLISIIDNSFASPVFQNPSEFGIDIIVHSATKYLNGHSDVVAGVLCSSREITRQIFEKEQMVVGNIISPHDASLMIRGLRTLEIRLLRSDQSAEIIRNYLRNHPKIDRIFHPFEPDNPQRNLAMFQMRGTGGLFSVTLKTRDPQKIETFCSKLSHFLFAVSWGGHESLVVPYCCFFNNPGSENPDIPINLVRFYVGLEDPQVLIQDLEQALETV